MDRLKQFFLRNTSTAQTAVKNTVWLFIGEFGSRLLKMVLYIYAARRLGVLQWGIFSYVVAIIGLVITFSDIGINTIITREIAKKTGKEEQYIATGFLLKIALSIVGTGVILLLIVFAKSGSQLRPLLPLAAIMFFLDSMQEFAFAINRAFEKMEIEAFSKIASNVLLVIVGIGLLVVYPTALSLAYGYIAADIIATVIIFWGIRKSVYDSTKKFASGLVWPLFIEAWPIATISIFGVVLANIDTLLLGLFKHTEAVGLYAAAQKPIQIFALIPSLISTALLPIFSRQAFEKNIQLKDTISRSITVVLAMAIPIAVGGVLIGGGLITLLFGSAYSGAIVIFKIMIITVAIGTPGIVLSNALFADGKQKKVLQAIAIGAVSNIALCLVLIPRAGLIGAAIATTLSQLIYNTFLVISVRSFPALHFNTRIGTIILATVCMAIAMIALHHVVGVIPIIIVAILIYAATLMLMKEPLVQDLKNVLR
jgi:O-antigen/teichoic acid export membrane protein